MSSTRRQFLKLSGAAALAATALPLFHFRREIHAAELASAGSRSVPKLGTWEDLYRER